MSIDEFESLYEKGEIDDETPFKLDEGGQAATTTIGKSHHPVVEKIRRKHEDRTKKRHSTAMVLGNVTHHLQDIYDAFTRADTDHGGTLSKEEFTDFIHDANLSRKDSNTAWSCFSSKLNAGGEITFGEFLRWALEYKDEKRGSICSLGSLSLGVKRSTSDGSDLTLSTLQLLQRRKSM